MDPHTSPLTRHYCPSGVYHTQNKVLNNLSDPPPHARPTSIPTGSSTETPSKPRAGTKRPRPTRARSQSKIKSPLPPAATTAAGGRENRNTQWNRLGHRQLGASAAVAGAGARGACGSAGGDRDAGGLAVGGKGRGEVVEDQLWPDKHRPRDVSDLAVHTKKVRACLCVCTRVRVCVRTFVYVCVRVFMFRLRLPLSLTLALYPNYIVCVTPYP